MSSSDPATGRARRARDTRGRALLALVGALVGFSIERIVAADLPERVTGVALLALLAGATHLMALLRLVPPVAALASAVVAGGVGALAGLELVSRYPPEAAEDAILSHPLALFVLITFPVPFVIAWFWDRRRFPDPAIIFDESWGFLVRVLIAWLFVGLAALFLLFAGLALSLVGIDFDAWLTGRTVAVLTGGAFGIALSIVDDLERYVSHMLVVRLLRVLIIPFLLLAAVFATVFLSLELSGAGVGRIERPDDLAWVLFVFVLAGVWLMVIAAGPDAARECHGPASRAATRVLALALPILALLAIWGHGALYPAWISTSWVSTGLVIVATTPWTIAIAAFAIRHRNGFLARVRRALPFLMATWWLVALAIVSPIAAPERLSAGLAARAIETGRLDPREMSHDILARERSLPWRALRERLSGPLAGSGAGMAEEGPTGAGEPSLLIGPPGRSLDEETARLAGLGPNGPNLRDCFRPRRCVLWFADLLPERPGDEILFIVTEGQALLGARVILPAPGGPEELPVHVAGPIDAERLLEAFREGRAHTRPPGIWALEIGRTLFLPLPLSP